MLDYQYYIPSTLNEALEKLFSFGNEAKIISGGTDLLLRLKHRKESAEYLIDIANLGLDYIHVDEDNIRIGSTVTLTSIVESAAIEKYVPILAEAAKEVGGWETQNIATIGGNICTGIPSADMAVPLLALDAKVRVISLKEDKIISLQEFFMALRRLNLAPDQMVKEIIISLPNNSNNTAKFIKLGKRKAMRLSVVNTGVYLELNPQNLTIDAIRIAMGCVAPTPIRLVPVEEFLIGKVYDERIINEAVVLLRNYITPRSSFRASREYRSEVAGNLFIRAVADTFERQLGGIKSVNQI